MKMFRKVLSLALVLTMLATCAVSGLVTVRAEGEIIFNGSNDFTNRTFTTETAGKKARFTGGTYGAMYIGGFNANYTTSEDISLIFDAGTFNEVNLSSRNTCNISGNIILTINGGTFNYTHDYNADLDYGVAGLQQPKHAIMMGDIRGIRSSAGASWSLNGYYLSDNIQFNNIAVIVDGGSDTLELDAIACYNRTPKKNGIWMAIINNCTDATVPTLSGNSGNETTLTNSTDEKFIDISSFVNGDYRMYVNGGKATPVFDGTAFLGFKLEANSANMIPKISYNYDDGNGKVRKKVVYPEMNADGIYDLSAYASPNGYDRVMIVEFEAKPVVSLGASLRYVNDDANYNGIRFGVKFTQNFVTGAGTAEANFGVILMAKNIYDAHTGTWTLEELKASEKARVATGTHCIADPAAQTYTVNAILYNIPEANYNSKIIAIPYIGDTLYTDAAAIRSMYEVALACVNDANASAEAKAYCQTIVDSVTNAAN